MNKKLSSNPQWDENRYHSFLGTLKGRMVTVYRHGPESKTGRLLDVQSDYIVLEVENNKVVYYQIHHVKSVSEDSIASQPAMEQIEGQNFIREERFNELFRHLKNEPIQINQGGPDMAVGRLVETSDDFIVLAMENNEIAYFNLHHVKSALKLSEGMQSDDSESAESVSSELTNLSESSDPSASFSPEILKAEKFSDLFDQLMHKWVLINRQGPDALEGILVENAVGHFTIINNQEIIRINPFHIKSFSVGPKAEKKEENNQTEAEEEEDRSSRSHYRERKSSRERRSERRSETRSYSRTAHLRRTTRKTSTRSTRIPRRYTSSRYLS